MNIKEASVNVEKCSKIKTHYCLKYLIQVQAHLRQAKITLINADGAVINTILDNGNGNGNMLVQRVR